MNTTCPLEMLEGSHTEQFDAALRDITDRRGAVYGHPVDDFGRVSALKDVIAECPDNEVRHALEMIAVKIARLIQSPTHLDSAIDIAGYARTICMIADRRRGSAAGTWIDWHGGECPFGNGEPVEVKFRAGIKVTFAHASRLRWGHLGRGADIIAYRLA